MQILKAVHNFGISFSEGGLRIEQVPLTLPPQKRLRESGESPELSP